VEKFKNWELKGLKSLMPGDFLLVAGGMLKVVDVEQRSDYTLVRVVSNSQRIVTYACFPDTVLFVAKES